MSYWQHLIQGKTIALITCIIFVFLASLTFFSFLRATLWLLLHFGNLKSTKMVPSQHMVSPFVLFGCSFRERELCKEVKTKRATMIENCDAILESVTFPLERHGLNQIECMWWVIMPFYQHRFIWPLYEMCNPYTASLFVWRFIQLTCKHPCLASQHYALTLLS